MASVVADTSAWVGYLQREGFEALELALEAAVLELPALVKLELLAAPLGRKERNSLELLLQRLPLIAIDGPHAKRAAELKAELEQKGTMISARDAHILQCVLDKNALFLTKDPLFLSLEKACGLRILV